MDLKHHYWYFTSALSNEVCDKLITLGQTKFQELEKEGKPATAETAAGLHKGAHPNTIPRNNLSIEEVKETLEETQDVSDVLSQTYIRDSEVSWIEDQWVYDLICPYVYQANERAGWNWDIDWHEPIQFTKYNKNGFYGWHTDGGSDVHSSYKRFIPGISPELENGNPKYGWTKNPKLIGKNRKLSVTINLSPDNSYTGGNLKIDFGPHTPSERYHECEEIRPRGSIIVFPSFVNHQITPVTDGTRYSLVMWTLGYPYR
jgi:PKHD-type hydroxylase